MHALRSAPIRRNVLTLAALGLVVGGCATPTRTFQPAQDHNTLNEIQFVHYLSTLPTVSMDEAYHALLLLADGNDGGRNFADREAALLERGVVRKAWGLQADDTLDQGTLAYMIVKTCRVPGGLNDALLGSWGLGDRRYALRTATWNDLLPYSVPYRTVTGGELLTAISKAAEYMERNGQTAAAPG
jgi:hypothetical protein